MKYTTRIRVLIVDDHILFNDGLVLQLSDAGTLVEVVGQVFRGNDVLPAVHRTQPDVVLLDINLPQQTGLSCARQLLDAYPAIRIIMLTMYGYRKFIDQCRQIGVAGYLLKHERIDLIIRTIHDVYDGKTSFPQGELISSHEEDFFIRQFKLTPTELKIITLIRQGLSSQQVAAQLHIGYETVRSHRKNIYRKLEITHLSELIAFANEYLPLHSIHE